MSESTNESAGNRLVPVWLAIGIFFALFVGVGTGILAWLGGDKVPAAIMTGGGGFIAVITVVILIIGLFRKPELTSPAAQAGADQGTCPPCARSEAETVKDGQIQKASALRGPDVDRTKDLFLILAAKHTADLQTPEP